MKLTVTLELDQQAYDQKYGPGSEWYQKYYSDRPEDYREFTPESAEEAVKDILHEGFYDWDCEGWMKVQVQQG